jgi:hypothetical protein
LPAVVVGLAAALGAACASRGEPRAASPSSTTGEAFTAPAVLARQRAATAAARVPALLDCREGPLREAPVFPVAFVTPDAESRRDLRLADLGDPVAQLRAVVGELNRCGDVHIELRVHDDYDAREESSLAEICDDVVRDEDNAMVIARGIPADALQCAGHARPLLQIGPAPRALLSVPRRHTFALGAEVEESTARGLATLYDLGTLVEGSPVAVVHRDTDTDRAVVENAVVPELERHDAAVTTVELAYDDTLGCVDIDAARQQIADAAPAAIVTSLDRNCLVTFADAMSFLDVQWVMTPMYDGTGDDAAPLMLEAMESLDGAVGVTPTPGASIRAIVPEPPPALGEACSTVTAAEGEDYEFGNPEYQSVEELCVAAAIVAVAARAGGDDDISSAAAAIAAIEALDELPLANSLLGGFGTDRHAAAGDVVYVQRFDAGCGCWRYVAGPLTAPG